VIGHAPQGADDRPGLHACARNWPSGSTARPLILTERPDVAAARIRRKRWVRSVLAERGESKHEYLAAVLGVSRQRVSRCLGDAYPEELSEQHLATLGLLDVRAA
jgi:hypothetical protein